MVIFVSDPASALGWQLALVKVLTSKVYKARATADVSTKPVYQ